MISSHPRTHTAGTGHSWKQPFLSRHICKLTQPDIYDHEQQPSSHTHRWNWALLERWCQLVAILEQTYLLIDTTRHICLIHLTNAKIKIRGNSRTFSKYCKIMTDLSKSVPAMQQRCLPDSLKYVLSEIFTRGVSGGEGGGNISPYRALCHRGIILTEQERVQAQNSRKYGSKQKTRQICLYQERRLRI